MVGEALPGILGQPCGKCQAVASERPLCLGHPPDMLVTCSVVSQHCRSRCSILPWGCERLGLAPPLGTAQLLWARWPLGERCRLALSEPAQFCSQALWVGNFRLCPAGTGRSTHCTCALSSGAEAKTILPKKEKLKLRRERWLQSKCTPCLLAVTWLAQSQEDTASSSSPPSEDWGWDSCSTAGLEPLQRPHRGWWGDGASRQHACNGL